MFAPTPLSSIPKIISDLSASFDTIKTRSLDWRRQELNQLWHMIDDNEEAIRQAVTSDIGKPLVQTQVLEIILVKNDIVDMIKNLDNWLASKSVAVPAPFEHWNPIIRRQPKGVCLAIGAWNYPVCLTLLPFIGIIACGNTGILKPSEHSPATGMLLAELFPKYLDPNCFVVVNGNATVTQALLAEPLGHVLYTGGSEVGKLVMAAAAKTLTPVTLELGGRNSAVVTGKANVAIAARRIAWGKYAIAGQTCFAPNQVLVQEDIVSEFADALNKVSPQLSIPNTRPQLTDYLTGQRRVLSEQE
jgi:acyl-CoA reductase-like NAD-dependent aldehyde dehydrogenase